MRFAFLPLLIFALAGVALRASGEEKLGTSYVELKGGIYSPSATFSLSNLQLQSTLKAKTKTGVDGEIAFGHYFLHTLALEAGLGYFKGKGSTTVPDFNVIPFILSVKALIPVGPVDPYGEAGVGAYFTRFQGTGNGATFSGSSTFGLHVGAGVNVTVSPRVFIGAEGRYVTSNPSFGGQTIKLNDQTYTLNGFKLNGFTTTLAVGYNL